MLLLAAAWVVGFVSLAIPICYLYTSLWVRPEKMRERLRRQGIKGPSPSFLFGNIPEMKRIQSEEKSRWRQGRVTDDYAPTLFPYFDRWKKAYGPIFTYSTGNTQQLYMSHPDLLKEIGQCKSLDLGKPLSLQRERGALLGYGILTSNGAVWAHQRKAIAPELFMDKVKGMVNLMVESAIPLLKSWEGRVECEGGTGEIIVDDDLRSFSADVISRACFGSNYFKGKEIFSRLRALQKAMSKPSIFVGIPGLRYLPNKNNQEIWRLEREIRLLILNVVNERKNASSQKDLLQAILESASIGHVGSYTTDSFIVDNCKSIYFAGHETTATSATWCLMLLASHPEWQARARAEVMEVSGGKLPDADMLRKMKMLTMVIQETLRLYPPAAFISREAFEDMKFGDINIPKGISLKILISVLHHDPEIWGPDVHEFNPDRFAHGIVSACKLPHCYVPFGIGARTCVGQNFAMVELKIVLSLVLSKFTFSLSPNYCHSPAFRLTIEPEFGVPLIVKLCK